MALPSLALTQRDAKIIEMVFNYEGLTINHVRQRFFPTPGARSACYDRVSRLVEAGYLSSHRLPAEKGSGKVLLSVGPAARRLLAEAFGVSRTELVRVRLESSLFILAHHLAIVDIRLAFDLACARSPHLTLEDWTSDRQARLNPIKVQDPKTQKTVTLVPDAAFVLSLVDGSQQQFLLEVDRSTVPAKRMRAKLRAYLLRKAETSPVLWVVPDARRQTALAAWAKAEAEALNADPTIFWVVIKEQIRSETVLDAPIWQVVGGPAIAMTSLVPTTTPPEPTDTRLPAAVAAALGIPEPSTLTFTGVHRS